MSFAPKTRMEVLLAKIAGTAVDLSTFVPPVATNALEEALMTIATKISGLTSATSAATKSAAGIVKMAANVPEAAGSAPTAAEFKALLDALIDAGIMEEVVEQ